jgi:DNA-binding NarL/FixJ family response regulator
MSQTKIKLFIVDNDPIFRLGLRTAIEPYSDFVIVGEGETNLDTIRELTGGLIINVLLIGVSGKRFAGEKIFSLQFCRQIRQLYPQLPLFLSISNLTAQQLKTVKSWQIQGYCRKGTAINDILVGLRRVAYGKTYWHDERTTNPRRWQTILSRWGQSGKQQIEASLQEIATDLSRKDLSDLDRAVLIGRKRELLAALWLINRSIDPRTLPEIDSTSTSLTAVSSQDSIDLSPPTLKIAQIFQDSVTVTIFQRVITAIQLGTVNHTNITLEIDILQSLIRQQLLYLVLQQVEIALEDLHENRKLNLPIEERLITIWRGSMFNFLDDYGGTGIADSEIINILALEYESFRDNISNQIYLAGELFDYLLGKPLTINHTEYRFEDREAIERAEYLLHNLLIQIANGVMEVILNYFWDIENVKSSLYRFEYRSTRSIARFRNELSWRYRLHRYWEHPQNVFESRYRLLILINGKIKTLYIYAPRIEELEKLEGLPWLSTIIIEIRDAVAPRVRAIISLLGSTVVFVLTQVIGRAIGLIGKGIIQGIGNSVKDIPDRKK